MHAEMGSFTFAPVAGTFFVVFLPLDLEILESASLTEPTSRASLRVWPVWEMVVSGT